MHISSPNPMFDNLLESSYQDNSNKWSNIWLSEEITQVESIKVNVTHLIWSSECLTANLVYLVYRVLAGMILYRHLVTQTMQFQFEILLGTFWTNFIMFQWSSFSDTDKGLTTYFLCPQVLGSWGVADCVAVQQNKDMKQLRKFRWTINTFAAALKCYAENIWKTR